jgi:hypothetical protein
MTPRSYALSLIVGAAALFLGLAAVNVILDPWSVFRLSPLRHADVNDRYDFYRIYAAEPDRYEALLLASSRGLMFSLDELSQHTNGERFARFSVSFGRLADHLGVLDFVLRDKATRHSRLKDVFLLIDLNTFGEPPPPGGLQLLQPPAISREPAFRFWWKNLTAIQVPAWERVLHDVSAARPGAGADELLPPTAPAALAAPRLAGMPAGFGPALARPLAAAPPDAEATSSRPMRVVLAASGERISERPYFEDDMRIWSRIVSLCRDNGVRLVATLSPLAPETYAAIDAPDMETVAERVSRIAPVWDFSSPREPSNTPDMWSDLRHYRREVAVFMLARIYGGDLPADWRNFGRVRGAAQ